MARLLFAGIASLALLWSPFDAAQGGPFDTAQGRQDRAIFKSAASTVHIYATVQGKDGRLVTNLTRDDFEVLDNNRPRPITVFDNTAQDITVAVMFDMSGSMARQHPRIRAAAQALVDALWAKDKARVGSFGEEVAISPLLTSDKPTLRRIVNEELWPGGATPLWHATEVAMGSLESEPGRRVVLLFTDGEDSGFLVQGSRKRVGELAERGGFLVYAVGLEENGLHDDMISFVEDTGGGQFLVRPDDDLGKTFAQVVEELHHQYVIGFSPEVLDGKSHKLTIRSRQPGTQVRGRRSYIANAATGSIR
jgi:Ca-activated chloride channel family protein